MKRFWLVPMLALAGLASSPSIGSAHFFFRGWCVPYGQDGYGYGRWGVPYAQPYFAPQYYLVPLPPPVIVPVPAAPGIPPSKPTTGTPRSDTPPRQAPTVTVMPGMPPPAPVKEADPLVKPAVGEFAPPMPAPAPLTIPDPMVPAKPPMVIPPLVLPGTSDAKPMPAPAPSGNDPLPAIPLPEPRKVPAGTGGKNDLPPLVLPPEGSGTSSGVIPSTSRSSPLTGAIKVQVFSASGAASGALHKVGFYNHTDRDLDLVIEGKSVKLPKKSYLHAELPAKFTWKSAGAEANATTVPDGAAGVDVLFSSGQ